MEILVSAVMVIAGWLGAYLWHASKRKRTEVSNNTTSITVDTSGLEKRLSSQIAKIPTEVITSVTNTTNTHKGKLGELVGYISIKAEYDRIIPLGNIVDIVGIKFPTSTDPGRVDFIDIKTGKEARLSLEQRNLKKVLMAKHVSFRTVRIDDIEGLDVGEKDNTSSDH